MTFEPTSEDARAALNDIQRSRSKVIAEIRVPSWYWWGLAVGWIALGALTDLKNPWITSLSTLTFGAVHASVAHSVIGGRRGNASLSVRREVAGRFTPLVVIVSLLALAGLTIIGAVIASNNGFSHPVTLASAGVAIVILLGGPPLMNAVRRRAEKRVRHA